MCQLTLPLAFIVNTTTVRCWSFFQLQVILPSREDASRSSIIHRGGIRDFRELRQRMRKSGIMQGSVMRNKTAGTRMGAALGTATESGELQRR